MSIIFVENSGETGTQDSGIQQAWRLGNHSRFDNRTADHRQRVVIPFALSFLLELTNKKGVATALKSALSATGSYLADTCLKLVVFIYAVGYIFGIWG